MRQLATVIIAAHNSQVRSRARTGIAGRQPRWQPPSRDCEALSVYFHARREPLLAPRPAPALDSAP